jgi:hypothetical protein
MLLGERGGGFSCALQLSVLVGGGLLQRLRSNALRSPTLDRMFAPSSSVKTVMAKCTAEMLALPCSKQELWVNQQWHNPQHPLIGSKQSRNNTPAHCVHCHARVTATAAPARATCGSTCLFRVFPNQLQHRENQKQHTHLCSSSTEVPLNFALVRFLCLVRKLES